MQPIYLSIQQEETGAQIRKLMMKNGYTANVRAIWFENLELFTNGYPASLCRVSTISLY